MASISEERMGTVGRLGKEFIEGESSGLSAVLLLFIFLLDFRDFKYFGSIIFDVGKPSEYFNPEWIKPRERDLIKPKDFDFPLLVIISNWN